MARKPLYYHEFLVRVPVYDAASYKPRQARNYVADAVTSWAGQFHPDDAMFEDQHGIKVFYSKDSRKTT